MSSFDYQIAFMRNRGLVTDAEQEILQDCTALIVGCGGVGGSHAQAMARLGVGGFRVVDPDTFDLANMNRQIGATVSSFSKPKAEVIATQIRDINPDATVAVHSTYFDESNAEELLEGVSVVLDGLDFFAIDARRVLYRNARGLGISVVNVGPIGMSAAAIIFTAESMSFDDYFDLTDHLDRMDKLLRFFVGLTPKATQRSYMNLAYSNLNEEYGPSLGPTCFLCSGVAALEALRIILNRPGLRPAPEFLQLDIYRRKFVQGRLRFGNRGPLQRLKLRIARRMLARAVAERVAGAGASAQLNGDR